MREITKKEIEEIYGIRKVLEVYALKCAIPRILDRDIDEVEKVFTESEESFEHFEIFRSIKERNIELAVELMANHIESSKKMFLIIMISIPMDKFYFFKNY
jgi:DNA-binding GntR family transcriptional regulator